ncbi:unnamed protein product, partial [Discosporangium mesarthrocarpum]
ESAEALLAQHPLGSTDDEGDPFWGGVRRPPLPLTLDSSNPLHREFVWWAAVLRAHIYGVKVPRTLHNLVGSTAGTLEEQANSPRGTDTMAHAPGAGTGTGTRVGVGGEEAGVWERSRRRSMAAKETDPDEFVEVHLAEELQRARAAASFWRSRGGDDDTNGHIDFVTAAANLRALNYGIPPTDRLSTKRIAGKIVPAIATTTAVVSGLACIELLKLVQGVPMGRHKNAFVNLATPFVTFSEPLEAEPIGGAGMAGQSGEGESKKGSFTIWDKVVVPDAMDLTPRGLINFLKREHGVSEVTMICYNNAFLYASFIHEEDHPVMDTPLRELALEADADKGGEDWMARGNREPDDGLNNITPPTRSCAAPALGAIPDLPHPANFATAGLGDGRKVWPQDGAGVREGTQGGSEGGAWAPSGGGWETGKNTSGWAEEGGGVGGGRGEVSGRAQDLWDTQVPGSSRNWAEGGSGAAGETGDRVQPGTGWGSGALDYGTQSTWGAGPWGEGASTHMTGDTVPPQGQTLAPVQGFEDPPADWFEEEFGVGAVGGGYIGHQAVKEKDGTYSPQTSSLADTTQVYPQDYPPPTVEQDFGTLGPASPQSASGGPMSPVDGQIDFIGEALAEEGTWARKGKATGVGWGREEAASNEGIHSSPGTLTADVLVSDLRGRRYLDLQVFCDDAAGEELLLPPVRLDMRSTKAGAMAGALRQGKGARGRKGAKRGR